MLFFQINVILVMIFILGRCEEQSKPKEENGRKLTKRQIIQAFSSNPIFQRVFQNTNSDSGLVNSFLGDGNNQVYTINGNGDYIMKIYIPQQIDDEDYDIKNNDSDNQDKVNDVSKYERSGFSEFYRAPETESIIEDNDFEDYNEGDVQDLDDNKYNNFNALEFYNFTSQFNFTDANQNGFFYNETQQTQNQTRNNTSQNIKPQEENNNMKEIPVLEKDYDENITVNNAKPNPVKIVQRNETLYVSKIHTNITNIPNHRVNFSDIPEIYQRIQPPIVNTLELSSEETDHYNNQPQASDIPKIHQTIHPPLIHTVELSDDEINHYNNQLQSAKKPNFNKATKSQNSNKGVGNSFLESLLTYFIDKAFFNDNHQTGKAAGLRKTNGPTDSRYGETRRNGLMPPNTKFLPQVNPLKNVPEYKDNDIVTPRTFPDYISHATVKAKVYSVPQDYILKSVQMVDSPKTDKWEEYISFKAESDSEVEG